MSNPKHTDSPFPIFPSLSEMKDMDFRDRPHYLKEKSLTDSQWREYELAFEFLASYGMRSQQTFNAYRGDVQVLLLWTWLVSDKKSISLLGRKDISSFIQFCH